MLRAFTLNDSAMNRKTDPSEKAKKADARKLNEAKRLERYNNAKAHIQSQIDTNPKYIDALLASLGIDKPHFLDSIKDGRRHSNKYINITIDIAENKLSHVLYEILRHICNPDDEITEDSPLIGRYKYSRFYPGRDKKFAVTHGNILITIIDGTPMFFHKSENIDAKDCESIEYNDAPFFYEHRGVVLKNDNNVFCISTRNGVIRVLTFQPPTPTPKEKRGMKEALENRYSIGLVQSILTISEGPFSALTLLYHDSFKGAVLGRGDEKEMHDIFGKLTWSEWGFMFGNTNDNPLLEKKTDDK